MALISCPQCGKKVFDDSGVCQSCGFEFFKCSVCGVILEQGTEKCPSCGKKYEIVVADSADSKLPSADAKKDAAAPVRRADRIPKKPDFGPECDKTRLYRKTFTRLQNKSFTTRLVSILPQKKFAFKVINIVRICFIALLLFIGITADYRTALLPYLIYAPVFLGWVWFSGFFDNCIMLVASLGLKQRMKKGGGSLVAISESAFSSDIDDMEGFPKKLHILRLRTLVSAGVYSERAYLPVLDFIELFMRTASWFFFRVMLYVCVLFIYLYGQQAAIFAVVVAAVAVIQLSLFGLISYIISRVSKNLRSDWVDDNLPGHIMGYMNLPRG